MSRLLYRLGALRRGPPVAHDLRLGRRRCGAVIGLAGAFGGDTAGRTGTSPAPAPRSASRQLRDHLPGAGGAVGPGRRPRPRRCRPLPAGVLDRRSRGSARGDADHVVAVTPPRLSADGDTALLTVSYDVPVTDPDLMGNIEPARGRRRPPTQAPASRSSSAARCPSTAAAPMEGRGELIGIVVALVHPGARLRLRRRRRPADRRRPRRARGRLGGVTLLAATMDVSTAAPMVASMVGLGVGIDYALLLVTRHVEYLRAGHVVARGRRRAPPPPPAARSCSPARTVLVSLHGPAAGRPADLLARSASPPRSPWSSVMAAALTLVPALCGFAGRRLLPRAGSAGRQRDGPDSRRRSRSRPAGRRGSAAARCRGRSARPLLMLALAAPALDMRTWPQDAEQPVRPT